MIVCVFCLGEGDPSELLTYKKGVGWLCTTHFAQAAEETIAAATSQAGTQCAFCPVPNPDVLLLQRRRKKGRGQVGELVFVCQAHLNLTYQRRRRSEQPPVIQVKPSPSGKMQALW